MLRTPLASERIQRVDPKTGVKVIQLTSYPLPSAPFLYDWPSITPDNRRVVFFCQRFAARDAPWDIFRADTDGLNLFQLTERGDRMEAGGYYGRPAARLTLDGRTIYCVWEQELCTVDVETGETEELSSLDGHWPQRAVANNLHISADGRRLFIPYSAPTRQGVLRVDLEASGIEDIAIDGHLFACDPTGPRLVVTKGKVEWGTVVRSDGSRFVTNLGQLAGKWITDEDGKELEYLCPEMYAHATLLGRHLEVQGCGKPPERCIWIAEKGSEPKRLVQGPYFWHSAASWDGEWIVADTNWPDQGLQLIHVPSAHFAPLCHPGATQDHYEFGHPHPALSQDGSLCVFRSDRTGVPQIYVAHITEDFRKMVIAGELDPRSKWLL